MYKLRPHFKELCISFMPELSVDINMKAASCTTT